MSKLLLDSNPLVIIPELAVAVGLNESIILQQLHYWLQKSNHKYDGRVWTYNTIPEWCEQFPFLAQRTIERTMASLKSKGLIITENYNKRKSDRTLWYSIDYEALEAISVHKKSVSKSHEKTSRQNGGMIPTEWRDDTDNLGGALPEITTKISSDMKNQLVSRLNFQKTDELTNLFHKAKVDLYESEDLKVILKETISELHQDQRTKEAIQRIDIFHVDEAIAKYREAQEQKEIKNPKLYFKRCLLSAIEEGGLKRINDAI